MDLDATQAIDLPFSDDETDDELSDEKKPVATLKVLRQKGFPETCYPIYEGLNLIGRDGPTCNVHIPIKALSKQHACIEVSSHSHLIYDKNSRNKTRKNKVFLTPDVRYNLEHGENLIFADIESTYEINNQKNNDADATDSELGSETLKEPACRSEPEEKSEVSSDILQPTQAYGSDGSGRLLKKIQFAEATQMYVADSEDDNEDYHGKTPFSNGENLVTETPVVRTKGVTYGATQYIPDSDASEDEDSGTKIALEEATMAYDTIMDSDTELEEGVEENVQHEAATQAYTMEEEEEEVAKTKRAASKSKQTKKKTQSRSPSPFSAAEAATQAYTMLGEAEDDAAVLRAETKQRISKRKGKSRLPSPAQEAATQAYTMEEEDEEVAKILREKSAKKRGKKSSKSPSPGPTEEATMAYNMDSDSESTMPTQTFTENIPTEPDNMSTQTFDPEKEISAPLVDLGAASTLAYDYDSDEDDASLLAPIKVPLLFQQGEKPSDADQETQICSADDVSDNMSGDTTHIFEDVSEIPDKSTDAPTQVVDEVLNSDETQIIDADPTGAQIQVKKVTMAKKSTEKKTDSIDETQTLDATQVFDPVSPSRNMDDTQIIDTDPIDAPILVKTVTLVKKTDTDDETETLDATQCFDQFSPSRNLDETQIIGADPTDAPTLVVGNVITMEKSSKKKKVNFDDTQMLDATQIFDLPETPVITISSLTKTEKKGTFSPPGYESPDADATLLVDPLMVSTQNSEEPESSPIQSPEITPEPRRHKSKIAGNPEADEDSNIMPVKEIFKKPSPAAASRSRRTGRKAAETATNSKMDEASTQAYGEDRDEDNMCTQAYGTETADDLCTQAYGGDAGDDACTQAYEMECPATQAYSDETSDTVDGKKSRSSSRRKTQTKGKGKGIGKKSKAAVIEQDTEIIREEKEESDDETLSLTDRVESSQGFDDKEATLKSLEKLSNLQREEKSDSKVDQESKPSRGRGRGRGRGRARGGASNVAEEKKPGRGRGRRSVTFAIEENTEASSSQNTVQSQTRGQEAPTKTVKVSPQNKSVQPVIKTEFAEENTTQSRTGEKRIVTAQDEENLSESTSGKRSVRGKAKVALDEIPEVTTSTSTEVTEPKKTRGRPRKVKTDPNSTVDIAPTGQAAPGRRGKRKTAQASKEDPESDKVTVKVESTDYSTANVVEESPILPKQTSPTVELERIDKEETKKTTRLKRTATTENKKPDDIDTEADSQTKRGRRGKNTDVSEESALNITDTESQTRRGRRGKNAVATVELHDITETASQTTRGRRGKTAVTEKEPPNTTKTESQTRRDRPGTNTDISEESPAKSQRTRSRSNESTASSVRGSQESTLSDTSTLSTAGSVRGGRRKKAVKAEPESVEMESNTRARGKRSGKETVTAADPNVSVAQNKRGQGRKVKQESQNSSEEFNLPATPARKQNIKTNAPSTPGTPTLRRRTMELLPRILFTGVVDETAQKTVKSLGGLMADSVHDCTHLVTDKVRRTVKLLCGVARGIPIVDVVWLENCRLSKSFVDSHPFVVKDKQSEKEFKFKLTTSLEKAAERKMFEGYRIHVTKSVRPEANQMKDIVVCAGGQYVSTMPSVMCENTVIVSCVEDQAACKPALAKGLPVVSSEFILRGVLRQELEIDGYRLFEEEAPSGTKRPAQRQQEDDHSAGKKSKRRKR